MLRILSLLSAVVLWGALSGCGESDAAKAHKKAVDASSGEITLRLAHASEAAGDFPASEKLYRQAAKEGGLPAKLELADFYRRHHGDRQALVVLNEALQQEPGNTDIMRAIANADIDAGALEKALSVLDSALARAPDDALLYNSKGVALDMQKKYTAARIAYAKALELDPDNAMLFNANLAMSYILTEHYSKAIKLLLPLAQEPDATPQVRQNLALAYGLRGESGNALKYALKDLPPQEAKENVRFYAMLAAKGGIKKPSEAVRGIPPIP